jgi:ethanolamine transporter EutH
MDHSLVGAMVIAKLAGGVWAAAAALLLLSRDRPASKA